jgi:hypothetical protein
MSRASSGRAIVARIAGIAGIVTAVAFWSGHAHAEDVTDNGCVGVVNAPALKPFFERARTGRVDVVAIGDSNQAFGGHGWDEGWQRALAERWPVYAGPVQSAGENIGNSGRLGWEMQAYSINTAVGLAWSGAPPTLDGLLPPLGAMMNYAYLSDGVSGAATNTAGIYMNAASPLDVNSWLRYRVVSGVFPGSGAGSFQPMIRMGQPPYAWFVVGPVASTRGPSWGTRVTTLDLPAASRGTALDFRATPFGQPVVGPFLWYYQRVESVSRANGVSFTTFYACGGHSGRDMASVLQSAPDAMLDLFFAEVRALQGPSKSVLVRINTGLNDRNETEPSVGPGGFTDGSSPEAYVDNLKAIVNRLIGTWARNGWPADELFFLISPSHPVSEPEDEQLAAYRAAAVEVVQIYPRTALTRFDRLTDHAEMLSSGWYQDGVEDRSHLTSDAFVELARREIDAARSKSCPGDSDLSGTVNFIDVTSVLANFGGCAARGGVGDANGDGLVGFGDITTVLANFGTSCL